MRIPKLKFTRLWTDPDAFPTVETDETVVRADMQALHNETQDYLNRTLGPTLESVGALLDDTISGLASQSTARKLGFSPTDGVNKTNVQDAIENVQSQIAGVALGEIPDGSIPAEKLKGNVLRSTNISCKNSGLHETSPFGGEPTLDEYLTELSQSPCLTIEYYDNNTFELYTKNRGEAVRYASPGKFFILSPSFDCVIPHDVTSVALKFSQVIGGAAFGTLQVPSGGTFRHDRAYLIVDVGDLEFMVVNQSEIEIV